MFIKITKVTKPEAKKVEKPKASSKVFPLDKFKKEDFEIAIEGFMDIHKDSIIGMNDNLRKYEDLLDLRDWQDIVDFCVYDLLGEEKSSQYEKTYTAKALTLDDFAQYYEAGARLRIEKIVEEYSSKIENLNDNVFRFERLAEEKRD